MDAATIRRLIVFGVCALGVAGLYLVPGVAGSTGPVSAPRTVDEPRPRTAGTATARAPQAASTGAAAPAEVRDASGGPTEAPDPQAQPREERAEPSSRPSTRGRTAFDPNDGSDSEPPDTVTTISTARVTSDELSLSWPAAADNRRVIGYRIWLNGYEVATTAETRATVPWFNDDEGQHVVQIKAIDAAGNQSKAWSTLLVTRPAPQPSVTPRPSTSSTPTPTPQPEPSESPSPTPAEEPTAQAGTAPPKPGPEPTDDAE